MIVHLFKPGKPAIQFHASRDTTVKEMKSFIAEKENCEVDSVLFLFQKVNLVDERTLVSYGINDGNKLLYICKTKPVEEKKKLFHRKGADQMPKPGEKIARSLTKHLANTFIMNPDFLQSAINSNPAMKELIDHNKALQSVIVDPQILVEALEANSSPDKMKIEARSIDNMLKHIECLPKGQKFLANRYREVQEPLMNFLYSDAMNKKEKTVIPEKQKAPSTDPLPFKKNTMNDMFGINLFAEAMKREERVFTTKNEDEEFEEGFKLILQGIEECRQGGVDLVYKRQLKPEEFYEKEIMKLNKLGCKDNKANLEALIKFKGNIYQSLKYIREEEHK